MPELTELTPEELAEIQGGQGDTSTQDDQAQVFVQDPTDETFPPGGIIRI
ncbi:hypothetical protein KUV89_02085 [Marinobacter hydrocarbonoclasticus]|nr:hypothetical protein [Marinobacter nauticus]